MTMSRHSVLAVASTVLVLALTGTSQAADTSHASGSAQAYPTKPIRLIIPFPPGGSADPLGRLIAQHFSEKLGVPVVGDNRPGAGTAIAHTLAAQAAPDGYTLLLCASSGMSTNPAVGNKLDYDPIKEFDAVGLAAYVPQLFVVHPSVPAKTITELIELSKAQPGKVNFGTPGFGSVGHLTVAFLNSTGGAKFTHVPYKGAGPAVTDLVAGRIQAFVGSVTGTWPMVSAGKIRAIATGHIKRLQSLPDMPTVAESFPGFSNDGWYGVVAPKGTPAPIIRKLYAQLKDAMSDPQFTKRVETIGMVPALSTPQELQQWVRSEIARWTKVVHEAGIQAERG
jgi:tripartite-type tricarboxylate transporter receptor subunit TctC